MIMTRRPSNQDDSEGEKHSPRATPTPMIAEPTYKLNTRFSYTRMGRDNARGEPTGISAGACAPVSPASVLTPSPACWAMWG